MYRYIPGVGVGMGVKYRVSVPGSHTPNCRRQGGHRVALFGLFLGEREGCEDGDRGGGVAEQLVEVLVTGEGSG